MPENPSPKPKRVRAPRRPKAPTLRTVGCGLGSVALSVIANHVPLGWGIAAAFGAVVCLGFSILPGEKWIRMQFQNSPIAASVLLIFLVAVVCLSVWQLNAAYSKVWLGKPGGAESGCSGDTGDAAANGDNNTVITGNCAGANSDKKKKEGGRE